MFKSKRRREEEMKKAEAERQSKMRLANTVAVPAKSKVTIDIKENRVNGKLERTSYLVKTDGGHGVASMELCEEHFKGLVEAVYQMCPPQIRSIDFGVNRPGTIHDGDVIAQKMKVLFGSLFNNEEKTDGKN